MYQSDAFRNPDQKYGPLQLVHDFQFVALNIRGDIYSFEGMDEAERRKHIQFRLDRLKERGFSGVAVCVDNKDYLEDDQALHRLAWAVDYAHELGMRVWLYDEQYYPTGGAGGLTLRDHPELEGMALSCVEREIEADGAAVRVMSPAGHSPVQYAFAEDDAGNRIDISRWKDPAGNLCWDAPKGKWHIFCFFLRPMYEASYLKVHGRAARRYPCVGDEKAIARFLQVTYDAYERVLGDRLGTKIETVFTDEPSYLFYQEYPENLDPDRDIPLFPSTSIYDRPHLEIPDYPYIPAVPGIEKVFSMRHGYDLAPRLPELFAGEGETVERTRRDFYETISYMLGTAYSEQYRRFLRKYSMKYSGHFIFEELPSKHPWVHGDILEQLGRLDIPGCDMLFSDPDQVRHALAIKTAASAAHQYGKEHVMIEMSNMTDRDQSLSLRQIELAMAMICALGADIITSYYGEELFGEEEYRRFADYTARLCQTLDGGRHVPQALFYYPFEQMASLTPPQAKQMPEAALELERELIRINKALLSRQVDYDFINRDLLLKCRVEDGRIITAFGESAAVLIFPPVSFVDEEVAGLIGRAAAAGVRVIFGGERRKIRGLDSCAGVLFEKECGLPASGDLMVENEPELTYIHKSFERQQVYLLVNTGREDIRKKAGVPAFGKRLLLIDPDRGTCEEAAARIADGRAEFDLILPAMTACMLVLE